MRISAKQLNRITNLLICMAVFFLQAYVDGKYIAHGDDPTVMKLAKYGFLALGIVWGYAQISFKKHDVFLRETLNLLFAFFVFFAVSLVLILLRNGDLGACFELILRYSMSVLYAYVLLNLLSFDDIYFLMEYLLLVSCFGWFLQHGDALLDFSNYAKISFANSYSPFESHYFSAAAINCCAFFSYYRKHRWPQIVSFLLVLITFKRVQIVFAVAFIVFPLLIDPNTLVKRWTQRFLAVGFVLMALVYYGILDPKNEWLVEWFTGQSAANFTMGRSSLLQELLHSGYQAAGLGSTQQVLGRTMEMDLISIMLEMGFPVMMLFVISFSALSGKTVYGILMMVYSMATFTTTSCLYNVFSVTCIYLFFGSINYLKTEDHKKAGHRRRTRIRFKL